MPRASDTQIDGNPPYRSVILTNAPRCPECESRAVGIDDVASGESRVACGVCNYATAWGQTRYEAANLWDTAALAGEQEQAGAWRGPENMHDTVDGGKEIEDVEPNTTKDL